jgi:hypothetical protein
LGREGAGAEVDEDAVEGLGGDTGARWVLGVNGAELEEFDAGADHEGDFELSKALAGAEARAVAEAEVEHVGGATFGL